MSHIKYRKDIDGLRALAVALVVIYHAFPSVLTGGFIGVDVFFVISGFLITSIILKEIQNDKFTIKEFYRRRIDRIFPALIIVLVSVYVFGWFTLLPDEYMQLGKLLAASSVFVTNIVLFKDVGYFDISSSLKPLLHLWSLGIEEQFYLIFPLILFFLYKKKLSVFLCLSVLLMASFLPNLFTSNPDRAFFLPQYRLWELFCGALLALMHHRFKIKNKIFNNLLSILGIALIIIPAFVFTHDMVFPGWVISIPILGAILSIGFSESSVINTKILSSRLFVFLGLISFPVYLWHWPLISFAYIINGSAVSTITMFILLLSSIVLAVFTYFYIEIPLKKYRSWKLKTIPLLVITIIIGGVGLITYNQNGFENRASIESTRSANVQLTGPMWQYTQNKNCMNRYQTPLSQELPWWFCMLKEDASPDLILVGNSYANHLYPAFAFNKKLKDLNILSIGTSDPTKGLGVNSSDNDKRQMSLIDNIIKTEPRLKYIVISGLSNNANDDYIKLLIERINNIKSDNVKIIVFLPHLIIQKDVKSCLGRPLKEVSNECNVSLTKLDELRNNFDKVKSSLTREFPSILFFDPNGIFCDENECSSIKNELPLYRDEYRHLSPYASQLVGDEFSIWAKDNIPEILN